MELFNSLKSRLETYEEPFKHWAINKPLTELAIKEVCNAEIANPINEGLNYDGTRAIDGGEGKYREGIKTGGKAKKYRCFITKENSKNFPNLSNFVEELCSKNVHQYIGDLIKKDLGELTTQTYLKYCDRKLKYGLEHIDGISAPSNIKESIAFRKMQAYQSKPSEQPLNSLLESLWDLDRFPILAVLSKNNAVSYTHLTLPTNREV